MKQERHIAALTVAAHRWAAQRSADPYDRMAREALARVLFELQSDRFPLGSVQRGQHLLSIMGDAYPIAALRDAYFANLDQVLQDLPERQAPGQVVLGLGSGRCGSTSLTSLVSTVAQSCCTHENPPLVYWPPLADQLDFHLRRFEVLSRFFALVFDASHWWLNAVDAFLARFPGGKLIALHREIEACARSFQERKAYGRGSINHWAPAGNGIWRPNIWDPLYPSYALPDTAQTDPDAAKLEAIRRYVGEYNARLAALAQAFPDRVLLVPTEALGQPEAQQGIFDFIGLAGTASNRVLNAGTIADGTASYWF